MPSATGKLTCVRCGREVRVNRDSYEIFERMHYVCFHYEFEHDPYDPDEECNAGGCATSRPDTPAPALPAEKHQRVKAWTTR
jgi:hypothetical protein